MTSNIRITEDGCTVITEDLLKLTSGSFEVSIIQNLNLSHLKIRTVQNFDKCESLISLDLSHNELAMFGLSSVGGGAGGGASSSTPSIPPSTTILTTSNVVAPPSSMGPLANISATLKFLDLSFNKLETIVTLSQFKRLEHLKLHGNLLESLEADVVSPLQGLKNLKVLTLQLWNYKEKGEGALVATNPLCSTTPRKEYVKIMATNFPQLRCLDGHYFNKELEDPFLRSNEMDDAFASWQPPASKPWITEQQFKSAVASSSFDPSQIALAAEKMLKAALSDAQRAIEHADPGF